MKAFASSRSSYCPLIWMFRSRKMEHRINIIHKKALKLVYQDCHDLMFQELLDKDKSYSVHQKSLQLLVNDIFNFKTGASPELMSDIFHFVERTFNLRIDYTLKRNDTVIISKEMILFITTQRAFLPLLPACRIFYQTQ